MWGTFRVAQWIGIHLPMQGILKEEKVSPTLITFSTSLPCLTICKVTPQKQGMNY